MDCLDARRVLGTREARPARTQMHGVCPGRRRQLGYVAHAIEPCEGEVGEPEVIDRMGRDAFDRPAEVVRDEPDPEPAACHLVERIEGFGATRNDRFGGVVADEPPITVAHDRVTAVHAGTLPVGSPRFLGPPERVCW